MIGQRGVPARSGGVERHVEQLSKGLVERGHRVIVFGRAAYVAQAKPPKGIEQVITPGINTKHLDAITHSVTALVAARKYQPDIVHIHGVGLALLIPLARILLPKAKIISTFHCIDRVREKWGPIAKLALRIGEWMSCHLADRTITVSQELIEYCSTTYGVRPWYVTHAIPRVQPPEQTQDILAQHGLEADRYFFFVGRLISDKGAHLLMEAYAKACEQHEALKQIPLVIVGASSFTDDYAKRLYQRAANIPNVKMLGERCGEELYALQSGALAHVFPSSSEGLAFTTIEACQYGRPVIASDIIANREATGGWMIPVPVNDIDALAQSLIHIVQLPADSLKTLGGRAKEHVDHAHDIDDRSCDMIRVYHDVLGKSRDLVTPLSLEHLL